ncbi:transketolase C-terminal domain-containing protein [Thalassospiraceae bacterium LMO-JJ14]|nr:transketolase C-terminal domain-containing protein [Thalassospiraceae bacterium LMO-JJ14]
MRKTCLNMVFELAKKDPRIVFVGSDLGPGVLDEMKHAMPERFYMEGVSEQHIIGMAAGLAMDGFIPYVNTIATFITRRCYEQLAVDLCLHDLPVRLIGNGGGLVYAPLGPTHLATEDIAITRALPNMTVVAPADAEEMTRFMAVTPDWPHPIYIRLGKGGDPVITGDQQDFEIGRAVPLSNGNDVQIISTGVMSKRALDAADALNAEGISTGVTHLPTIKPLDLDAVISAARSKLVVTLEEHFKSGGLGSAVSELLIDGHVMPELGIVRLGLDDIFPLNYGSQDELLEAFGLQPAGIAESIQKALDARR